MELYIGVMEGTGCFNLTCLAYSYLNFAETGGATFWAEEGSSYYVVVAVPWYAEAGPFTLIAGVSRARDVTRVCTCCVVPLIGCCLFPGNVRLPKTPGE